MKFTFKLILTALVFTSCFTYAVISVSKGTDKARVIIANTNIIKLEGDASKILKSHSVLIEDGVIKAVFDEPIQDNKVDLIIDGRGKFLLPGLIDVHVHIWDAPELAAYLSFGITTIRNTSGMPYHLKLRDEVSQGIVIGPRIITTGPILNGQGPNTQVNHQVVTTEVDAITAVRDQYSLGFRHLKVYSNLSLPAYKAILKEAERLNMSIMGHSPEGIREEGIPYDKPFQIPFTSILDDGFVSIEHMESIIWHALVDDPNEEKLRKLAQKISKSKTPVTPTLVSHHNLVQVSNKKYAFLKREGVNTLNPFISEIEQESYDYWLRQPTDSRSEHHAFYKKATKIFQEEGVTLLAGTDSGIFTNIPGKSLIDELNLMVDAGLTPSQVLKAATVNSAGALGLGNKLGKVDVGYIADLILVDNNPLDDISELLSLSGVLSNGVWHDSGGIEQLKKIARNTSYVNSKKNVVEGLATQGIQLE